MDHEIAQCEEKRQEGKLQGYCQIKSISGRRDEKQN